MLTRRQPVALGMLCTALMVPTGCVSEARHRKLQQHAARLEARNELLQTRLSHAERRNREAALQLAELRQTRDELGAEAAALKASVDALREELGQERLTAREDREHLMRQVEDYRARAEALDHRGSRATQRLLAANRDMQRYYHHELLRLRADLAILRKEARATETILRSQLLELESRTDVAAHQRAVLEQQQELLAALQEDITEGRASVRAEHGRVVVALSTHNLFTDDGEALTPDARACLGRIAAVLRRHPDHEVRVVGHVETPQMSDARFPTGWHQSTARAVAVVDYFASEAELPPDRLSAVGQGEHRPLPPELADDSDRVEITVIPSSPKPPTLRTLPPPAPLLSGVEHVRTRGM